VPQATPDQLHIPRRGQPVFVEDSGPAASVRYEHETLAGDRQKPSDVVDVRHEELLDLFVFVERNPPPFENFDPVIDFSAGVIRPDNSVAIGEADLRGPGLERLETSGATTRDPSDRCSTTTYAPDTSPVRVTRKGRCESMQRSLA
jgi:hypothetical protein